MLFLSPVPTHPQTAGNRTRIATLLNAIRELGHELHFLHVRQEPGDEAAMRQVWGDRYSAVDWVEPRPLLPRIRRKLLRRFIADERYTLHIDEWYDRSLDEHLTRMHARHHFDVVLVSYVFMSKAFDCFPAGTIKILDTHDSFANRHRHYLQHGEIPRWYSTSPRSEGRGFDRADVVFAIQDLERQEFASRTRSPVVTIGHITPVAAQCSDGEPGTLLFVASNNEINTHGLQSFLQHAFPQVREQCPHARLVLAGSICDTVPDQAGVQKLGRVDDLAPVYARAAVVINPVEFNTGLSIKNLEALGLGKPLVTNRTGTDGIESGKGTAFLSADNAAEFAEATIRLLGDDVFARRMAAAALQFAQDTNQRITTRLEAVLHGDFSV